MKLCDCGCGLPAPIATYTNARRGYVKGQPVRFINGHCKGNLRHGARHTPEYWAYTAAKARCTDPRSQAWPLYGGRGIRFLFASFEQFLAEIGPRPAGMTLDRTNNDGHYEPGNCRWATRSEQQRNKRKRPAG